MPAGIDSITKAGLAISPSALQTIASFLNKSELGLAMIGALHLRLPDLEAMQLVKAGFDPNEPRDDQGRWANEDDGTSNNPPNHRPPTWQDRNTPIAARL